MNLDIETKAAMLQLVLPAFKELYFTPEQLGMTGGDPDIKIELAQHLQDIFTDRSSMTITVQQDVFIELGKRIKALVESMQGGMWLSDET